MKWLFTLIDRDNNQTGIDEPVGFDACTINISRDLEKHGIIFEYQGNDFSFYDEALELIQAEYEAYGVEGLMTMVIAQACEGLEPEELYRGQLLFGQYKFFCGDECYVKIPLETANEIMTFTNRFDQKVNLQTTQAFDEITPLPVYNFLPLVINLPSKGISIRNKSITTTLIKEEILGVTDPGDPANYGEIGMLEMANDKIIASEIGGFGMKSSPEYQLIKSGGLFNMPPFDAGSDVYDLPLPAGSSQHIYIWPRGTTSIINWSEGTTGFTNESIITDLHFRFKGRIIKLNVNYISGFAFVMVKLNKTAPPEYLHIDYLFLTYGTSATHMPDPGQEFDIVYNNTAFVLNPNDEIFIFFTALHTKTAPQADLKAFRIEYDIESFFDMGFLSYTAPTPSKVFMVNEALSRITEAITEDKIKAYSEYFGRPDSQPYSLPADGCGALEVITKGLFIRQQENRIAGQSAQMAVSMKDMWEGLEPLHHIGLGFEDDDLQPGFKRLRIEHWKYFYKEDLLMDCDQVNQVERSVQQQDHYSKFKTGYEKWEAEEFNGLDEFLTQREYRTVLTEVKNELSKLSKFIASGYAWEVTRRKNTDSKDWRYDNDTFLVCLRRLIRDPYAETFTGQFLVSSFITNETPVDLLVGDVVSITGSTLNDGFYTIDFLADLGGGSWGIYFTTPTTPEVITGSIIITLNNPGYEVELGNILIPENIIDPDTLYNYRISPARIALRWLDKINSGYRFYSTSTKLIFVDGTGNYLAKGEMESPDCKWEAGLMGENDHLYNAPIIDQENVMPILRPERIDFEYPMSIKNFKDIKANPYGKITWLNHCDSGQGWIDKISYKPETGLAKFSLIPKYE